jgi:mRNA interferase YafQ
MKPAASSKRAKLPRECEFTNQFHKDWQALSHSGRYDMVSLKQAMMLLIASDAPLGPEWLDHALKGDWSDHRECHIGGDFLLIYRLEQQGKSECVRFVRAGTHAQLFGM